VILNDFLCEALLKRGYSMAFLGRRVRSFHGFARLVVHPGWVQASVFVLAFLFVTERVQAQEQAPQPLRPGEAYVTRFSGTKSTNGADGQPITVIDTSGTVGSIIDIRSPGQPPRGEHWIDEPQRSPVAAGEVGQVFGVALDDATPPNIYIASTSAFGIHRTADNQQWMPGMWGPGGPGAIYRLDAADGYRARPFATITLNGRPNSGPALGNIAFDRWNRQFFVSDLETGMIHRIGLDGADRGQYDHGVQARPNFLDAQSRQPASLAPIALNPSYHSAIFNCPAQPFDRSPHCWNFAQSGRRVWGLGVTREGAAGEVRLYYSVWSGPAFGEPDWDTVSEDDKRNSVWSVRIGPDGSFDVSSVRREFLLPDFFVKAEDIARNGYSQPVSDLSFPACSDRPVMLVAERGGIRNLGLAAENPFAYPHESRTLRYELDQGGVWRPIGRYDIGFYERIKEGQPHMRANCAGGAAFGPGYKESEWQADPGQPDQFVWMTGDSLCSPDGPCNLPAGQGMAQQNAEQEGLAAPQPAAEQGQQAPPQADNDGLRTDDSEVHGVQGMRENAYDQLLPPAALSESGDQPTPPVGPNQAYLIDTDINVDSSGALIEGELTRNDATKIGDIAIYQICAKPPAELTMMPPSASAPFPALPLRPVSGEPPPSFVEVHRNDVSHFVIASHGRAMSHYRLGSHELELSHGRWGSHTLTWSHSRFGSHNAWLSHNRIGSHDWRQSHSALGSHSRAMSHFRIGSHNPFWSHSRVGSHNPEFSHGRTGSHDLRLSHIRLGSHIPWLSHARLGSHNPVLSHARTASHDASLSHSRAGSHSLAFSHTTAGSHSLDRSHGRLGSHDVTLSRGGTHNPAISEGGTHNARLSQAGGHTVALSSGSMHNPAISEGGTHNARLSQGGGHTVALSSGSTHNPEISQAGRHNARLSQGGGHTVALSSGSTHNPAISKGGAHNSMVSRGVGQHSVVASRGISRHSVAISHRATVGRRVGVRPPHYAPQRFVPPAHYAPRRLSRRYAPRHFAPQRFVPPAHYAPRRLSGPRYAPRHFAPQRFVPPAHYAPRRFSAPRYAPRHFAPQRFVPLQRYVPQRRGFHF
jgi:hypothetical protein